MNADLNPIEKIAELPQGKVHYWTYNADKKPTILMVHGFRGTHHGLEKLIAELPDFRVIVPDMPGFGASPPMANTVHNVENYSVMLIDLVKNLQLIKPILFGHSMGTIIVANMIAAEPKLADKAIMVNPVASNPTRGISTLKIAPGIAYHHLAGRILPEKIGVAILRNKLLFLLGSATMTMTKDKELRKWIHWNHITYMKQFSDRKTLLEAYTSSSTTTIADYKEALELPLLMIAGKKDAIAPSKAARKLADELKNATLIELENVGHIIHYEKAKEAGDEIKKFLK